VTDVRRLPGAHDGRSVRGARARLDEVEITALSEYVWPPIVTIARDAVRMRTLPAPE
jgi:hypothetical protein